ncbi:MAG TPA: hypothetical protein ENN47_07125 [Mesotoga infera]|uniref:LVIVD repeat protein n=1 Tax=Mesotoga infera TaxID=1236046 RepID=A0A7C1GTD2_9BACT|nr:hypothetical protein [Mesotoga infera]
MISHQGGKISVKRLVFGENLSGWNIGSSFIVADVPNPAKISVSARVETAGDCTTFLADSGRLYCLEREFFEVFDIADIENIKLLKRIEGYSGVYILLDRTKELLYLSNWRRGIAILDISNRDNPTPLGSADCDCVDPHPVGNDGPYGMSSGLCLRGNFLFGVTMDYVTSRNLGALYVYDVSDPSNPKKVTKIPTPDFRAHGMDSKGNYVFAVGAHGILSFDISIPEDTMIVGELKTGNHFLVSAKLADDFLFAVGVIHGSVEQTGILDVIDISNPLHPRRIGGIVLPLSFGYNIAIDDEIAYIACDSGVAIVDIGRPESPRLLIARNAPEGKCNDGIHVLDI